MQNIQSTDYMGVLNHLVDVILEDTNLDPRPLYFNIPEFFRDLSVFSVKKVVAKSSASNAKCKIMCGKTGVGFVTPAGIIDKVPSKPDGTYYKPGDHFLAFSSECDSIMIEDHEVVVCSPSQLNRFFYEIIYFYYVMSSVMFPADNPAQAIANVRELMGQDTQDVMAIAYGHGLANGYFKQFKISTKIGGNIIKMEPPQAAQFLLNPDNWVEGFETHIIQMTFPIGADFSSIFVVNSKTGKYEQAIGLDLTRRDITLYGALECSIVFINHKGLSTTKFMNKITVFSAQPRRIVNTVAYNPFANVGGPMMIMPANNAQPLLGNTGIVNTEPQQTQSGLQIEVDNE